MSKETDHLKMLMSSEISAYRLLYIFIIVIRYKMLVNCKARIYEIRNCTSVVTYPFTCIGHIKMNIVVSLILHITFKADSKRSISNEKWQQIYWQKISLPSIFTLFSSKDHLLCQGIKSEV